MVENLDRWGADGIVVLSIDRQLQGPDLKLLKRLSQLRLSTPLTYGGGIRTAAQALAAVQTGAERLVIDRALSESSEHIAAMAAAVGRQALIASIPLRRDPDGAVQHWEYWQQASHPLHAWLQSSQWHCHVSEVLAIDVIADGFLKGPDPALASTQATRTSTACLWRIKPSAPARIDSQTTWHRRSRDWQRLELPGRQRSHAERSTQRLTPTPSSKPSVIHHYLT